MRFNSVVVIGCLLTIGLVGTLNAQDTGRRTQDLVAALDKTKYKSKEKKGVKVDAYVDVKNEAVVKADPSEYSGVYVEESGLYRLQLRVARDGSAEGAGFESGIEQRPIHYTLKDAHVEGALLTGTRLFDDGRSDVFEAVFAAQTRKSGTSPGNIEEEHKGFGLGYLQKNWDSRVFLVKR